MTEPIGLKGIFETKEFQRGLTDYLKGLKQAEQATTKTADGTSKTAGGFGAVGPAAGGAAGGLSLFTAAALGAAAAVGIKLVTALTDGIRGLVSFGKESVLTASRVGELTIVSQILGQRAGYTRDRIFEEVDAIKELGIRTDVALKLVAQFARRELDLADATKLADVARNSAIISMQDTSDALDQILHGILTYNKRVLRTAGLNVDIRGQFKLLAEELDTTTEQLSEQQKVQAALNGVFLEGVRITGLYEAVQAKIPGKQLRSLKRDLFDLQDAMGKPFQDAFLTVIGVVREFTQSLTEALKPPKELRKEFGETAKAGGQLFDLMTNLGAAASIMADGFKWAAETLSNWLIGGMEDLNERMETTAKNAFEWGINIAVELADGLITGAVSALTWAMNQITALFTYWLSGASPPKAIPDLPKWGANAMTEFLKGFTLADFSALKAIQQPLQRALSILVQTGEIGKAAGGRLLANLSKELAKALSGGKLDPGFFGRLAKAAGPFGSELADLTKKVLELARAEETLEKAQRREEDAVKKVRDGIEEYNNLLRAGASEQALDARLALINAQEAEAQAAREQKSAVQDQMDVLKEAVSLQQKLLDQLLTLTQAQIVIPDVGEEAGKSLAAGIGKALEDMDLSSFTGKWDEAIASAKERLLALFDPVTKKWEEDWEPLFTEFSKQWDLFEINVLTVWFRLFGKERGIITMALRELDFSALTTAWGDLTESLGNLGLSLANLVGIDTTGTSDFFKLINEFMKGEGVPFLQNQIELLAQDINSLATEIDKLTDFLPFLFEPIEIPEMLSGYPEGEAPFDRFLDFLGKLTGANDDVKEGTEGLERVQREWRIALTAQVGAAILNFIIGPLADLTSGFSSEGSLWMNLLAFVDEPISNLITGLSETETGIGKVMTKIDELQAKVIAFDWGELSSVQVASPAPMAVGLRQVQTEMGKLQLQIPSMTNQFAPAMAGVPIAGGSTKNITLNFSAAINSGMDMTTFEDRVSRIVINLLT